MLALANRLALKALWVAGIFLGITLISFAVIHLAPGSPTDMQTTLNPLATAETRARLEKLYGLDRPLPVQYLDWLGKLVRFDFGQSLSGDHRPVWDKIRERLPLTFSMMPPDPAHRIFRCWSPRHGRVTGPQLRGSGGNDSPQQVQGSALAAGGLKAPPRPGR